MNTLKIQEIQNIREIEKIKQNMHQILVLKIKKGCNKMEAWKANLIEGSIFLVVGLFIIIINSLNVEAIDFLNNGNQITASLNPTFVVLLITGFFLLGVGTAQSAVTITIRKFEKT